MLKLDVKCSHRQLTAILVAWAIIASAGAGSNITWAAGGACKLVPNDRNPSEKILRCGQDLTVQAAQGTRYQPLYKAGQRLPAGARLDDGALLIEFHPTAEQKEFQILTPLAIAAVRGTKWAVEVGPTRTSTLVLSGEVAVTNRRLNQYVVLSGEEEGVDISPGDASMSQKRWSKARVRALLSRFGE